MRSILVKLCLQCILNWALKLRGWFLREDLFSVSYPSDDLYERTYTYSTVFFLKKTNKITKMFRLSTKLSMPLAACIGVSSFNRQSTISYSQQSTTNIITTKKSSSSLNLTNKIVLITG